MAILDLRVIGPALLHYIYIYIFSILSSFFSLGSHLKGKTQFSVLNEELLSVTHKGIIMYRKNAEVHCRPQLRIRLWLMNFPTGDSTKMDTLTVHSSVF
jgi:hypothetical protein